MSQNQLVDLPTRERRSLLHDGGGRSAGEAEWSHGIGTTSKLDRDDELRTRGYDHILHATDPGLPGHVKDLTRGLGTDAVPAGT
ncbi:hypothetical protein [Amycolatopsis sp. NPDC051371]|uniref:hypothetical protein n=1 Tax=Amycolatopsis sp. NPDC051371 TaxID=3155800 RepID=UPI003449BA46